ncbi:MAG: polysaccharide biosynthesis C-terminal domain-containing protein, partial [Candidatus Micrarchaeaceae archaeon]
HHATQHIKDGRRIPVHVRSALPFMWLGGLYLLVSRTDLIMLGTMKGAHDAGIYAVASRAAELVSFFAAAANVVLAPRIARLYHSGEHTLLQRMLRSAAQRFLILTIPLALLLIFAASPLLHYLYGAEYTEGAIVLRILAGAQFFVLALGSVNTILNMTGNERLSTLGVGLAAILNIALNAVLIPDYGAKGAAIATGLSLVFAQGLLWYWVRHRLGLRPSGFGF